ncbi:hypothetical protein [Clostridium psychrophilum]|uniref:hypothetical protein n=1 Tax=Clostridium psychrophilum TaxID=132926 RepID=UPI001FE2E501|nr:hypothetical protein [Clostridium psychrophilum]
MIGNVLLVWGLSMFMGGLKNKSQKFAKEGVNISVSLLTLAVISLVIPAVCTGNLSTLNLNPVNYENLSIVIAIVMLIVYSCSLYFSFFTHKDLYGVDHEVSKKKWSLQ